MRRFFKWCIYLFGRRRILNHLEAQVTLWDYPKPGCSLPKSAALRTVPEIADRTGLPQWQIRICLRRLRRCKLVEQPLPDRWRVSLYT